MIILSFDIGLRNLGVSVIQLNQKFAFPPQYLTYETEEETPDAFKQRALRYFLTRGWCLLQAQLIDVSEYLGRDTRVKSVKKLSLINKAKAIHAVLQSLENKWFPDSAPDITAVEIQHGANADMRAVCLTIPVFFLRSMEETEFVGIVGGQKLKLCDAMNCGVGSGLLYLSNLKADKKEAKSAATAAAAKLKGKKPTSRKKKPSPEFSLSKFFTKTECPPLKEDVPQTPPTLQNKIEDITTKSKQAYNPRGRTWLNKSKKLTTSGLSTKEKYDDNKGRSMKAMLDIVQAWEGTPIPELLLPALTDPNVADCVLQGLWVLWQRICPRAPIRRKARMSPQTEEDAGIQPKQKKLKKNK
jgi:hypothetical protein